MVVLAVLGIGAVEPGMIAVVVNTEAVVAAVLELGRVAVVGLAVARVDSIAAAVAIAAVVMDIVAGLVAVGIAPIPRYYQLLDSMVAVVRVVLQRAAKEVVVARTALGVTEEVEVADIAVGKVARIPRFRHRLINP